MKFQIVNTWNGGEGGRRVVFTSSKEGNGGHNECFEWIHKNTPFSFHEATTNQGYVVEEMKRPGKEAALEVWERMSPENFPGPDGTHIVK